MEKPFDGFMPTHSRKTWLLIFGCLLYFACCFGLYTVTVEPVYGLATPPTIEADSGTYFDLAGLDRPEGIVTDSLISMGGSSLGPVTIARIFRTRFGVALFNCALFLLIVWWAGLIPGVRREYFAALMVLEPQTMPTLLTLNKEILAIAGLVSFAAYLYGGQPGHRRGSKWLLAGTLVWSILARWEQVFVPLWYVVMECRWSPVRGKPRQAIMVLLLFASAGWAAAIHVLHLNLGGFIAQVQGGGWITRLYAIQERGGYFLVAFPKTLMNIAGRWITPGYFLHDYWLEESTGSWQNDYIGILSSLTMLILLAATILRGRFRLSRPLIHLTTIYFIFTSINPFIQHRYIYPAYALLALEFSRRGEMLEPAPRLPTPPSLPPSYRTWERAHAATAADAYLRGRSSGGSSKWS